MANSELWSLSWSGLGAQAGGFRDQIRGKDRRKRDSAKIVAKRFTVPDQALNVTRVLSVSIVRAAVGWPSGDSCRARARRHSVKVLDLPGCIDGRLVLWPLAVVLALRHDRHSIADNITAFIYSTHDPFPHRPFARVVHDTLSTPNVAYNNPNLTAWAAYALPTGRQRAKLRRRPDIDANGEADESACRRVRSARWPQLTRRPPTHRADAFCNTMPIWLEGFTCPTSILHSTDYMAVHTTPLGLACNSPI
ncbi:hypothetical protein B0H11DRAFT_2191822 [Mycena galericulata]|nr:hypothetical protein B0H11DRAFT_2191822 [Mycena galericulata]